ncbi:flagellar motor switch protein FliG [Treponema primitia]|uniref:flagellar motor switch protein FliG n=1 Tax=Treponema primitia TaxID=88058 RepID=UPI000684A0C0|nr:flagellar motor switch protein FliG [Treponema primitia]
MAKIRTPVWPELSSEDTGAKTPGAKAPLSHGIAAYQNTMKPKESVPEPPPRRPPIIPEDGFVKTGETTEPRPDPNVDENPFLKLPKVLPRQKDAGEADSKLRRVAKFLILIGGDEAAGILSKLDVEQVEAISREIATIRGISKEEAAEVLEEFRSLLSSTYGVLGASSGGVEAARRLLYAAFGAEKGSDFLNRALPETKENALSFLEDFTGEQIALLLKEEFPAAAALILSRLPSKLSASVLVNIEPGRKMEIVKRIAHQGQTAPEVLEQVAAALREKARRLGSSTAANNQINLDGRNALAAILKQSDYSFGDRILQELDEEDPELSQELKERLHTLEDVIKAEDRPLQEKFRSMTDQDIALLLKGKDAEFTDKILSNVSAQRRNEIREEIRIMGPVPRRDVDEAVKAFLTWFRQCREEGRILLIDDKDVIL